MVIWYIAKSYILLQCIFMSYMLILAWLILLWIMMMYNPPDNVLSCLYLSMSLKKESSNFGPQGWPVHLHSGPGLRASDCRPQGTSALGKERGNTNGMCLMGLYNGICCRWDWMDNNYWDISVFILFPWDILSITSNGIATYFFGSHREKQHKTNALTTWMEEFLGDLSTRNWPAKNAQKRAINNATIFAQEDTSRTRYHEDVTNTCKPSVFSSRLN